MNRGIFRNLWRDERGAVSVYAAMGSILVLAFAAFAIDIGRLALLRSQTQSMADSLALAAANELDGGPNAMNRAMQTAFFALEKTSGIPMGSSALAPMQITFYSSINPDQAAINDDEAYYVRVEMSPSLVEFFFTPFIRMVEKTEPGPWGDLILVQSTATAHREAIACNMPPFMVCDPTETAGSSASLFDSTNAGRGFRVKGGDGNGGFSPGQFGLICPGDDGNCGASAIGDALESVNPGYCVSKVVTTAPGQRMNQVRNGVNSRFDTATGRNNPAPNVMNYSHDTSFNSVGLGTGEWNAATYWTARHGKTLPAELAGASRYQAYLYELGETFARNGKQTLYPVSTAMPSGFVTVTPPGKAIPVAANSRDRTNPNFDGVPQSTPVNDPMRRVFTAAVLKCKADNVRGSKEYSTRGRFVRLFFYREAGASPDDSIYAEVIGGTEPDGPIGMFRSNPRLVQ